MRLLWNCTRYKPFGVVILFYPLSSVKLPIFICLTSLLHTTFVRSLPFCFCKFSTIFSIFGADENRWHQPRNFGRLCVIFADTLCSSVSWTGPGLLTRSRSVWPLFYHGYCKDKIDAAIIILRFTTLHSPWSSIVKKTRKVSMVTRGINGKDHTQILTVRSIERYKWWGL